MDAQARLAKVKAVYFDLDDTLCAYWDAAKGGLRAAFEQNPVPGRDTDEMYRAWADEFRRFARELKTSHWYEVYLSQGSVTRDQLMQDTLKAVGVSDSALAHKLGDAYGRERDARLTLFPDAKSVLEDLHGRFPLGLITNGPADVQRQEIETLGIGHYFDHVFIEGEMGIGKPHASVMRRAEAAVGHKGREILFVGNSYLHDVLPAIEIGWCSVWVRRPSDVAPSSTDGLPERKPDGAPDPDLVTDDLTSILEALP